MAILLAHRKKVDMHKRAKLHRSDQLGSGDELDLAWKPPKAGDVDDTMTGFRGARL